MTPWQTIEAAYGAAIEAGLTEDQAEANAAIIYAREVMKDTAEKRWFHAPFDHASVGRALGIDPAQEGATFALNAFRPVRIDGAWHICAPYPTPRTIGVIDEDWLGIEDVLAFDPVSGRAHIVGEAENRLFGQAQGHFDPDGHGTLYAAPRAFLQGWAMARARFWGFAGQYAGKAWQAIPEEPDLVPGALIVGDVNKVRWPVLPETLECVGIDPAKVNGAILRGSKLPRCVSSMRLAA